MIVTPKKITGLDLTFTAPPSKSYTHRALIAAALAKGKSTLFRPLESEDTRLTAGALRSLGIVIEEQNRKLVVIGCDGRPPDRRPATLELDNSGTSLRLLTTLALLCHHPVVLTGSARMQERPIGPLADALPAIGGSVEFLRELGYPPIRVSGKLIGGPVVIDGAVSSQFISSILMAAPYAECGVEAVLPASPASASYLDITLDVMGAFGADIRRTGYERFVVSPSERYTGRRYTIEGDYSSASYFFAIAAACRGKVRVTNLVQDSVQGDRRFLDALEEMGCSITYAKGFITVERTGDLRGITFDMSTSPDTVQTLSVVAAMATTPTTITGIGHLKFKESDRINGTADKLRSLGCGVDVGEDSLTILPAPLHGGTIDPENDHRTAMSFAVLGLAVGEVTITNAECVSKSFPGFWDKLSEAIG
ncbi:MAG: 3-phosphoshikimate 1-carboxyvinyltransferase [Methanoregula sp. SKADARSKE-2]|nr:MAG: 3-phosphoshikimate 1-carboxyvinyltransferase [Methanoregula sp. SKADARSKE-2]